MEQDPIKKAREMFLDIDNCAQAVFRTILEEKELYFEQAPIAAAGFGGGISRRGEMCGSLTGAIMAIGILQNQKYPEPVEHRKYTYESVGELIDKFNAIHGSPICNDLVGFDVRDPEARKKGNDEGVFKNICPKFVEDAVRIVLEMFPD
ncbi:MAG: C_GCAxxG_C_C family protein [Asgard group archaeon]|nr:C_GCAxxG_C_C family protein [Asgard group archaeon]